MKATSLESSRWVPMTTSTVPAASPARTAFCWTADRKRESISTRTGYGPKRSRNVFQCCSARMVVGTRTATWWPSRATLRAARIATSVLP